MCLRLCASVCVCLHVRVKTITRKGTRNDDITEILFLTWEFPDHVCVLRRQLRRQGEADGGRMNDSKEEETIWTSC